MALHVALVRSGFRTDGMLHPRVVRQHRVGGEALLNFMAKDTALEKADMRATMEQLAGAFLFFLAQGDKLETRLGTFSLGMLRSRKARSRGGDRMVDASGLHVRFVPARDLISRLREITDIVVEEAPPLPAPVVNRVISLEEDADTNAAKPGEILVQPGRMIALRGAGFSLDPKDAETGVFFVDTDDRIGPVYRAAFYSRTGSACIDCRVPELPEGRYQVQVRTRPTGRGVRTGAWDGEFVVG